MIFPANPAIILTHNANFPYNFLSYEA